MQQAPWLAMWSGIFLTIVVYSFNMFGDAVRFSGPRRQRTVARPGVDEVPRSLRQTPDCYRTS